jgi:allantoin racemase
MPEVEDGWQQYASPGTKIDQVRAAKGAESIECIYDAEIAAPFILEQVRKADLDGVDAIIINCMGDPALQAAWEVSHIPVVGIGLACFAASLLLGDTFSIITPRVEGVMMYKRNLRAYRLEKHLASIRSLGLSVMDLRKDSDTLKQRMRQEGQRAIQDDGAHVIIPGCSRIYGISDELSRDLGVPVLDPRAIAVKLAEMLASLSLNPSKKAYPLPPEKRRTV